MKKTAFLLLLLTASANSHLLVGTTQARHSKSTVLSVTMQLSARGVEADTYPSIAAALDFERHTSRCDRSYYNPTYPSSTYYLSAEELDGVQRLLQRADLEKLKTSYSTTRTDQPTATTVIRTASRTFTIKDYGLKGDEPLPELYRLVYKSEY